MKIIEVDPCVLGNCDKIPFPERKQCSPELDSPSCQSSARLFRNLLCLQEKATAPLVYKGKNLGLGLGLGFRV